MSVMADTSYKISANFPKPIYFRNRIEGNDFGLLPYYATSINFKF